MCEKWNLRWISELLWKSEVVEIWYHFPVPKEVKVILWLKLHECSWSNWGSLKFFLIPDWCMNSWHLRKNGNWSDFKLYFRTQWVLLSHDECHKLDSSCLSNFQPSFAGVGGLILDVAYCTLTIGHCMVLSVCLNLTRILSSSVWPLTLGCPSFTC